METRANHVWVGAVTLVLLALLAGFIIWLAGLNKGEQNEYDIFFKQSVAGLAKGSEVTFAGVPADLIDPMRDAVITADLDTLMARIDAFGTRDPRLAAGLRLAHAVHPPQAVRRPLRRGRGGYKGSNIECQL